MITVMTKIGTMEMMWQFTWDVFMTCFWHVLFRRISWPENSWLKSCTPSWDSPKRAPVIFGMNPNLSGWWYTYPSKKYDLVSWDDEIFNIWKNKKCSQTTNQLWFHCHGSNLYRFQAVFQATSKPGKLAGMGVPATKYSKPPTSPSYLLWFLKITP